MIGAVQEVDQEGVEDREDEVDSEVAVVVVVEAEVVEEVSRHGREMKLSRHSGYEILSDWLHQHAGYLAWGRSDAHLRIHWRLWT